MKKKQKRSKITVDGPLEPTSRGNLIALGNFDTEWHPADIYPGVAPGSIKTYRVVPQHWASIEATLGHKLDKRHRGWIEDACAVFIFVCAHKGKLLSQKKYVQELDARAKALCFMIKAVLFALMLKPMGKDGFYLRGRISSPNEHVAAYAMQNLLESLKGTYELYVGLKQFRTDISGYLADTAKGRESHYELQSFFMTLFWIAKSVGAETGISSRSTRETYAVKRKTALENFAGRILDILSGDLDKLVALYELTEIQRGDARNCFERYFSKKDLTEDLMAARSAVEVEGRPKKWSQKRFN